MVVLVSALFNAICCAIVVVEPLRVLTPRHNHPRNMWKSMMATRAIVAVAVSIPFAKFNREQSFCDGSENKRLINQQPAFVSVSAAQKGNRKKASKDVISLDSMILITGSAHIELSKEISQLIGVPLANADLKRFADGEVSIQINENLRGKDVFIVQPCAAPVNDSIMELLLTVSCARSVLKLYNHIGCQSCSNVMKPLTPHF